MKFSAFREYRRAAGILEEVVEYLRTDLNRVLKDLNAGLTEFKFLDNFESFSTTVTIAAGAELEIRNGLRSKQIPSLRIIVRGKSGAESVVDGDTEWSKDFVYLKNTGASSATVTVLFFR